ncbi:MAG: gliding motility-associated C-terminal domain-containing protein [Bacteroidota bacterium]
MYTGKKIKKYHWILFLCILFQYGAKGQGCPPNIGFETGDFTHWQLLAGYVNAGGIHLTTSGSPVPQQHSLYKNTGNLLDPYGKFPVNCPDGGNYTLKLGNDDTKAMAEGVYYTFTIPADRNDFSLIYHYAVVLQNPNHSRDEQPKFMAQVFNVTTNQYITCSSFEYVATLGLPGFKISSEKADVLYKEWTPVTIKLSGYAGATIRLEFTTNDCIPGAHFGYAYVDVGENCVSPVSGTVVCQSDSALNLIAPYGFSSYKWFDRDFSKVLGTGGTLRQTPIPQENTVYAVELVPSSGRGCADTAYAYIRYSTEALDLNVTQAILADCINEGVDITKDFITAGSSPGLSFTYYTDPELKNRYLLTDSVIVSGTYYIKATNADGCFVSKSITVKIDPLPVFTVASPKPIAKPGTYDLTKAVSAGGTLSYWMNAAATIPLANPSLLDKNGTYYVKITSAAGCVSITSVAVSFVNPSLVLSNVFSPNGDGINDTWEIPAVKYYPECTVEIFSRSGQSLFRSVGYEKPWDGKLNGKSLPIGTYYYVIRATLNDPPTGGSVTIVR